MSNLTDLFGVEPLDLSGSGGGPPTGVAGGSLSGTYPNPDVVKIQGVQIDPTAPVLNQVLTYDGTKWKSNNISAANITSGTLPTAQLPIVPKNKGGFGQDVSTGLNNGDIVKVSGGTIVFGPPSSTPTRVQLALLSDLYFNNTLFYQSQFISIDSTNKSYSTSLWNNIAGYSPVQAETLSKFSVQLSAGVSVATNILIWVQPYLGVEYDTGIVIPILGGDNFAQNLTDTISLSPGDCIKFTTDNFVSVQWVSIFANRQ
jgi:hypothetical protein